MRQAELARRLGVHENRLHRLVEHGVIRSSDDSFHGKGGAVLYDQGECRAAATVIGALRSQFFGGQSHKAQVAKTWDLLAQVADVAAQPLPSSGPVPRWVIVADDGVTRGGDWLASVMVGHRVLIPLVDVP